MYWFILFFFACSIPKKSESKAGVVSMSVGGGFIPSGDANIFYRVFGSGPPLLIINGGHGLDSQEFSKPAQSLAQNGFQAIIFDRRGLGQSTLENIDESTITMDAFLMDIENLRAHFGFDSWSVMGHSFGGMLASYYVSKYPQKVNKLILSSSAGVDRNLFEGDPIAPIHKRLSEEDKKAVKEIEKRYTEGERGDLEQEFSTIIARAYVYDDSQSPIVANRLSRSDHRIGKLISEDIKRINLDTKPENQNYDSPVLIIQGKQDIMPEHIAQIAHETFPNSRLVLLDECGHYGWLDQKDTYIGSIVEFLKE